MIISTNLRFSSDPEFLEGTQVMKSKYLRDKFKNNGLVKPLYRRVKPNNVLVSVHIDSSYNLDGEDFKVKREISDARGAKVKLNRRIQDSFLPGTCEGRGSGTVTNKVYDLRNNELKRFKMIGNAGNSKYDDGNVKEKLNKVVQAEKFAVTHNVTNTWLRVHPLPQLEKESVCSTVFRCVACQFGIASILVLWTLVWVFVIHSFEGPFEMKVCQDFEREQNQLVIDLATELRQITPLTPKWREVIEKRIQEERQLTIAAVGRGARAHPGQFWDLAGTFLFTIYVMTALGFGAPVPQTLWGRSAALIYALIAVPAHIYLMVNASTCAVAKCSTYHCPLKNINRTRRQFIEERNTRDNIKENINYSRNSEMLKTSKCNNLRKKIMRCVSVVSACRCVPLVAIVYFASGAVAFGVLRGRTSVESVMFPIEFTTTGGLEHVLGHIRIMYGFYVEGAMMLLACTLATLRRYSNNAANSIAERYRLFQVDV